MRRTRTAPARKTAGFPAVTAGVNLAVWQRRNTDDQLDSSIRVYDAEELMQAILDELLANADVNVGLAFSRTTQLENVLGSHETNDQP